MTIERRMTRNPVTADAGMTAAETLQLMKSEGVDKVPVLDGNGRLCGVITEKDILRAKAKEGVNMSLLELACSISNMTIENIMTKDVISITPDTSIEEVARMMVTRGLSFIPVTDAGMNLVGLVSKSDMFKILMELFGARQYGTRISFVVDDKPGALARISARLSEKGIQIISLCTFAGPDPEQVICTLKVEGADEKTLVTLLGPEVSSFVDLGESE